VNSEFCPGFTVREVGELRHVVAEDDVSVAAVRRLAAVMAFSVLSLVNVRHILTTTLTRIHIFAIVSETKHTASLADWNVRDVTPAQLTMNFRMCRGYPPITRLETYSFMPAAAIDRIK
jgi:hypothetical protein